MVDRAAVNHTFAPENITPRLTSTIIGTILAECKVGSCHKHYQADGGHNCKGVIQWLSIFNQVKCNQSRQHGADVLIAVVDFIELCQPKKPWLR